MTDIAILLAAAAAVNRLVELIKPAVDLLELEPHKRKALLVGISITVGVGLALSGDLTLLADAVRLPTWLDAVLTGALIGLGADAVNGAVDVLYSWRRPAGQNKPSQG